MRTDIVLRKQLEISAEYGFSKILIRCSLPRFQTEKGKCAGAKNLFKTSA